MSHDAEFIVACLKSKCADISTRPTEKPCPGLAAFQDGLTFAPKDIANGVSLFDAGIIAIRARFRFARLVYESERGASEMYSEEFVAVLQEGGQIEVRGQIVLKNLTPDEPSIIDQINGKA